MVGTLTVEELLTEHTPSVAATAARLRGVLLEGAPGLDERVRPGWHSVNYHHSAAGFVCAIFPITDRVQLVFQRGALLPDPDGRLIGTGRRVRLLEFTDVSGIDPPVVLEFLDLAVELGSGLRARSRRSSA
jgi:hypothetical protein